MIRKEGKFYIDSIIIYLGNARESTDRLLKWELLNSTNILEAPGPWGQ